MKSTSAAIDDLATWWSEDPALVFLQAVLGHHGLDSVVLNFLLNLGLMIEVIAQRIVDLGQADVRIRLGNFFGRIPRFPQTNDEPDCQARVPDNGRATTDTRSPDDVGVLRKDFVAHGCPLSD